MKVMITGAHGYIGPHLIHHCLEKGWDVVGVDLNLFYPTDSFMPIEAINNSRYSFLEKDIRTLDASDLKGIDAICHLAAISNDPMGNLDPDLTYSINWKGSVRLAKEAKEAGVKRFVFSSSCSLYGVADTSKAVTETNDLSPVTAYAISKARTEEEILPLADDHFAVLSLRNATAYGYSPMLRLDLVANQFLAGAFIEREIRILSDGSPWRPLVHCEDIARAFVAGLDAPVDSINGVAVNIGNNSENYQVKDIAKIVADIVPNCDLVITGEHGADTRSYRVSFDYLETVLPNFKTKWNLETGMKDLLTHLGQRAGFESDVQKNTFTRLNSLKNKNLQ